MKITYIPNKPDGSIFSIISRFFKKSKPIQSICIDFSKTNSTISHDFVEDDYIIRLVFDDSFKKILLHREIIKHNILSKHNGVIGFLSQPLLIEKCFVDITKLLYLNSSKISFNNVLPKDIYTLRVKQLLTAVCISHRSNQFDLMIDNNTVCSFCGSINNQLTREHIIPKIKQSENSVRLFTKVCRPCNLKRRSFEYSDVLESNHWFLKFLELNYGGSDIETLIKNGTRCIKSDSFYKSFTIK